MLNISSYTYVLYVSYISLWALLIGGICAHIKIDLALPPTPVIIEHGADIILPSPTPSPFFENQDSVAMIISTPQPLSACIVDNLGKGEHISSSKSYTQTQWVASGPMVCRIERDSCAYNHLVGLLEASIIFKEEEVYPYNTEDRLMHPAMILPLYRLNKLILAEWDNTIQLRVTDAYDSLLEHDLNQSNKDRKYSLHFEGRAIDLTTSPVSPEIYGRLCALAHCAGFDWVHNEGTHCHASIKATSLCYQCNN